MRFPTLSATNVAARGLDVDHIERVINYELPETHDLFTHRVGRTPTWTAPDSLRRDAESTALPGPTGPGG